MYTGSCEAESTETGRMDACPSYVVRLARLCVPYSVPSSNIQLASCHPALDPTKLKARQFARTATATRKVDNSLWTETPAERQQRIADEVSGKKRRAVNAEDSVSPEEALAARKKQRRDEEIKRNVDEYTVWNAYHHV